MRPFAQRVALCLLRAYKWAISPMFPPACRYTPTCSEYAMEAIERYGVLRGGLKAAARVLRCHPFVKGGYDPVVKPGVEAPWKRGPLRAASDVPNSPGFSPGGRS
ncbi:MAG: membrane protein insertion efficiency factor YidD [Acidobacteriia bacterium]|nr:membrane protein insertion efficiency factor YidD [Terriglobia bacterium]